MARKHFSQFTPEETGFVTGFIRRRVAPTAHSARPHFYHRATDRRISLAEAQEALQRGRVIEIHDERREWRALVRAANGICVVVSLETNEIVTAYYNDPEDQHSTLDRTAYRGAAIDAVQVIKDLLARRRN